MIAGGVSHNRVVILLPDDLMGFLETEADQSGLSRGHVVRTALRALQARKQNAAITPDTLFEPVD
jgi:metal-responsive CopG/Arc/MetJ family transcriptional regulator